jgi:hypothetical protein
LLRACYRFVTCRRYQTCWNNLLRVCWPHQPCYKMIPTCSRLVNNWEQAVRTHLVVDKLWDFYAWLFQLFQHEKIKEQGVTHPIDYRNNCFAKEVRKYVEIFIYKDNSCIFFSVLKGIWLEIKLTVLFFSSLIWKIIENCRVTSLIDFCFLASFWRYLILYDMQRPTFYVTCI